MFRCPAPWRRARTCTHVHRHFSGSFYTPLSGTAEDTPLSAAAVGLWREGGRGPFYPPPPTSVGNAGWRQRKRRRRRNSSRPLDDDILSPPFAPRFKEGRLLIHHTSRVPGFDTLQRLPSGLAGSCHACVPTAPPSSVSSALRLHPQTFHSGAPFLLASTAQRRRSAPLAAASADFGSVNIRDLCLFWLPAPLLNVSLRSVGSASVL